MKEIRQFHKRDRDVCRGRDACQTIMALVDDAVTKGKTPLSLTISRRTADGMKAFLHSFTRFDGVLPQTFYGVPLLIDLGADKDFTLRLRKEH